MKKILLALAAVAALSGCVQTSDGEKLGVVVRVASESWYGLCPTNEVEIVRGGLSNGSGVVGAPFHATITNPADLKTLTDAMEKQQEVKITYRKDAFTFCSSAHNYFISSVAVVAPSAPAPTANASAAAQQSVPGESREQKIVRLLAVQAALIEELAGKQGMVKVQ